MVTYKGKHTKVNHRPRDRLNLTMVTYKGKHTKVNHLPRDRPNLTMTQSHHGYLQR